MRVVFFYRGPVATLTVGTLRSETCYQDRAIKGVSMRYQAFLIALALLAACERKAAAPEPQTTTDVPAAEVGAADAYGAPGEDVNDVAFWSHPSIAFESLVITVTDAAVEAFAIETGDSVFSLSGGADAIDVFYAGASSPGYLVAAGDGAYRFFAFAADGKSAAALGLFDAAAEQPQFCVKGGSDPVLYEIGDGAISSRTMTIAGTRIALGDPIKVADAMARRRADAQSGRM